MAKSYRDDCLYFEDGLYFFSPDGIGRVFFDTLEEANNETGLDRIIIIVPFDTEGD